VTEEIDTKWLDRIHLLVRRSLIKRLLFRIQGIGALAGSKLLFKAMHLLVLAFGLSLRNGFKACFEHYTVKFISFDGAKLDSTGSIKFTFACFNCY
jgi:predicted exporter